MKIKITEKGFNFDECSTEDILAALETNSKAINQLPEKLDAYQVMYKVKLNTERKLLKIELYTRAIKETKK